MREMSLAEAKQCSLEILLWIDRFCSEKKISWWLCGGTLLGAIRHKGFIPWDDDIDIMLPRREYERLEAEFPKEGRYKFLTPENTKNFSYQYGKIYDTYTWKDEGIRKRFQRIGVDIDVFPIDDLPSNNDECRSFYHEIERKGLALAGMRMVYGKGKTITSTILKNSYIFSLRLLEWIGVLSYEKTQKRFIELAQKYNNQGCEYCGITCINHYGMKERNLKKGYEKTVMVEFEGHLFPAPDCYDTYLTQLYGENYMQLPPVEKRVSHHEFKTYWK